MNNERFNEGDILEVTDPHGKLVGVGKALQSRGIGGLAHFDILTHVGATLAFNLNSVTVRVIYSEPSADQLAQSKIDKYVAEAFADVHAFELHPETLTRAGAAARRAYELGLLYAKS